MRKLIILRGAQGSGKSTFVKKNDLERFTLSADTIRLMLNSPELTIDHTEMIPQFNNKKTWNILYSILEERMTRFILKKMIYPFIKSWPRNIDIDSTF